jgi:hypothetical protein
LNLSGDQRTNDARRSAADDDHFGIDAVFFKEAFFFGHPNATGCGTDRAQAYSKLILGVRRERKK